MLMAGRRPMLCARHGLQLDKGAFLRAVQRRVSVCACECEPTPPILHMLTFTHQSCSLGEPASEGTIPFAADLIMAGGSGAMRGPRRCKAQMILMTSTTSRRVHRRTRERLNWPGS
ncbi:unnamed protein product [Lepidochelys kempii]